MYHCISLSLPPFPLLFLPFLTYIGRACLCLRSCVHSLAILLPHLLSPPPSSPFKVTPSALVVIRKSRGYGNLRVVYLNTVTYWCNIKVRLTYITFPFLKAYMKMNLEENPFIPFRLSLFSSCDLHLQLWHGILLFSTFHLCGCTLHANIYFFSLQPSTIWMHFFTSQYILHRLHSANLNMDKMQWYNPQHCTEVMKRLVQISHQEAECLRTVKCFRMDKSENRFKK